MAIIQAWLDNVADWNAADWNAAEYILGLSDMRQLDFFTPSPPPTRRTMRAAPPWKSSSPPSTAPTRIVYQGPAPPGRADGSPRSPAHRYQNAFRGPALAVRHEHRRPGQRVHAQQQLHQLHARLLMDNEPELANAFEIRTQRWQLAEVNWMTVNLLTVAGFIGLCTILLAAVWYWHAQYQAQRIR